MKDVQKIYTILFAGTRGVEKFFVEGGGGAATGGDEVVDGGGDAGGLGIRGGTGENPDGKVAVPLSAGDFAADNFEGVADGSFRG